MSNLTALRKLTASLFPKGRAFRVAQNSVKEKVINAITITEDEFISAADSVLNHILPDNDGFTVYDAELWELRLGINANPLTSLADRKAAIIQKLNHPGNILARQSAGYIEQQLQLAGFNVYVHENIPATIPNIYFGDDSSGIAVHSEDIEHMETGMEHGSQFLWNDVVANKIDYTLDQYFDIGPELVSTFFICDSVLGNYATIPQERREEFRQLILQLKPVTTVAYLAINYI